MGGCKPIAPNCWAVSPALACYLGLRWRAFADDWLRLLRRRGAWLLFPSLLYVYQLVKGGDPAIPWLPYFSKLPVSALQGGYAMLFLFAAFPLLPILRPPSVIRLFASLPLSGRQHRIGDALLALAACMPLPALLLAMALASWLCGGRVDDAALGGIGWLGVGGTMMASSIMWLWLQWQLARGGTRYRPPLFRMPVVLTLPLNVTLAALPAGQRRLLQGVPWVMLGYLASVPFRYHPIAAMLAFSLMQFFTRMWQLRLHAAERRIKRSLGHWPIAGLSTGVAVLAFLPYLAFHAFFVMTIWAAQPVNPQPLLWLCLAAPLQCLLCHALRDIAPERAIFPLGFGWAACLAIVSELTG
ncbi:hypothetical protein [Paludibacterium paludis]|uniref:Uncharacterized protein n=1 Tax=Paludibacterium paludis TaxID=1225769 RepID=A0A918P4R8_9NEIS|nr:hypothetical protein [Paludibacterium paludis]GGY17455.1 hypothetical protein GCM10011289_21130 [Paludibacterium paludis]